MMKADNHGQQAEVFFSYASEDKPLRDLMEKHLVMLKRHGVISAWHDRMIEAGEEWAGQINAHINSAQVILLLVSVDFLCSDYCYDVEMKRAMERHEAGEARVIPVILRPCDWQPAPFGKLQALPDGAKPVTRWSDYDEAFLSIVQGIRQVVKPPAPTGASIIEKHVEVSDLPPTRQAEQEALSRLSYLCNRKQQEAALKEILSAKNAKPRRPLICILHGNDNEGRDMYKWRLLHKSLPQLLHSELPVRPFLLPLPRRWPTAEEAFDELLSNLAERVAENREADIDEVAKSLSKHRSPVMIRAYFKEESWEPHGAKLLEKFINYWNEFPDLPPTSHLIICLSVTYLRTDTTHTDAETGTPGQQGARSPRVYLQNLDFNRYSNLHGVVLPEMMPVPLAEAEEFLNDDSYFSGICKNHSPEFCNVQGAVVEIRSCYEFNAKGEPVPLPMEYLAKDLERILKKNRC